jgi:hypothetical protein
MIDKVSDFFKDIKDRLSSPFFSSFIIAWIIINWKVPVSLIWYNQAELEKVGYKSHFNLIGRLYNPWFFLWIPILSALGYCLLYPFMKYGIMIVQAKIRTWGTNKVFEASKEAPVTMEKYLEQRQKYEKLKAELSELYKNESIIKSTNESLRNQVAQAEIEKTNYIEKLQGWANRQHIGILKGVYDFTITDINDNTVGTTAKIDVQTLQIYSSVINYLPFDCLEFHFNPDTKSIAIFLVNHNLKITMLQFLFPEKDSLNKFSGTMLLSANEGEGLSILFGKLDLSRPLKVEYSAKSR